MKFIEYFQLDETAQKSWSARIAEGDWRAAKYLAELLKHNTFQNRYGPNGRIFLLTEGDSLAAFCTLVPQDEIADETLTPWIGFVYTFPRFRGHRYSQKLIDRVCSCAKAQGHRKIYLSSEEQGLYEKYDFLPLQRMKTAGGDTTQVYVRML